MYEKPIGKNNPSVGYVSTGPTSVSQSLHVGYSGKDGVPMPVTFYVSPEVLEDKGISAEYLADILKKDLVYAIEFYREQRAT